MDAEDVLIKYDPPFLMALKRSELRVVPELFFPTENKFSGFREAGEYAQSPHSTDNPGESLCARGGLRMQREEKGRDIATHRLLERKGKHRARPVTERQREVYRRPGETLLYLSRFCLTRPEMQAYLRHPVHHHPSNRGFQHTHHGQENRTGHLSPGLAKLQCGTNP